MAGKIFYRKRTNIQKKTKTPRFRIVAVSDIHLDVYRDHFRKKELERIAKETGARLVALKRDKNSKKDKKQ